MSCLPTDHPKNLVDFRTFHRTGKFRVSDGCLGNKVYQQLGGRVDMQHSDVWGSVQTWVVTWLFSILQRNFHAIFVGRPFRIFFLLGRFSMERWGVFFATGKAWVFVGTPNSFGALLVLLQDGEDRDSSDAFGAETRLLDQAPEWLASGFFRPDVGIAFLRWNETRFNSETSNRCLRDNSCTNSDVSLIVG